MSETPHQQPPQPQGGQPASLSFLEQREIAEIRNGLTSSMMNKPIWDLTEAEDKIEVLLKMLDKMQFGQPAEPVEGATALEALIEAYLLDAGYASVKEGALEGAYRERALRLADAARQEAANRRPSTGKEGDVKMPDGIYSKLTSPESTPASRGAIPSTTGEDERDKKDWAQKLADKIHSAPWTPGETRELILRHLHAPSHSDVEPPWAKLRPFTMNQHEDADGEWPVFDKEGLCREVAFSEFDAQMICAALNGESK